jgi:hypothetical protein
MTNDKATSIRPVHFPDEYGQTKPDDYLPWEEINQRIAEARNYWLATVAPDGRPHVRPVDGVWVDGALCFGGSDETRWVRNLQADSRASINLPSDELACILEGRVQFITDEDHPLAKPSAAASKAKYPQYFTEETAAMPFQPFWLFRPRVVYAWTLTGFPNRATRWTF